ncbi:hypothetical protein [Pseudomonas sp. R5(2019)]|uniref:hypothetical protein n=1 Tax=Pseudomonas sp. R5(2019) TaxID=2697566 RepID=UPI001412AA9F|nr:hypothetical protein [Pseudomonas sp. R5(2019)]NBA97178.1 hypothetical protein [Pseudomonas sp. R5(2019)]
MTKAVPDPPAFRPGALRQTGHTAFSSCGHSHDPLFDTRPGIIAEDALTHVERHLQSAYAARALEQALLSAADGMTCATPHRYVRGQWLA